ncbi:MAG TPA: YjbQ family protein, partial [Thermopetrobacter sp.]|nr:YjbQ family protein [Thermopetrobacter sp.]
AALTDVSLTVPVGGGRPLLGTWQGIFLFEHRARPHRRQVVAHLSG